MSNILSSKQSKSLLFISLLSLLLTSCGITDELLVFEDLLLPKSDRNRLVGRYEAKDLESNSTDNFRLDIIDEELAISFCDENELKQYKSVISQVPDRDNLYVMAFPEIDATENAFVLLKIDEDKLDYWNIDTSNAIVKEYYPEAIENKWYVYPTNEVKDFLVNYGNEYIEVNPPDAKSQYVDDSPLNCT